MGLHEVPPGRHQLQATVVVDEGTFQARLPMGYSSAGTWKRDGGNVTVAENGSDGWRVFGLPDDTAESVSFKIGDLSSRPDDAEAATATWDGKTLRFSFDDITVQCIRG